jgi:hypothetical protein
LHSLNFRQKEKFTQSQALQEGEISDFERAATTFLKSFCSLSSGMFWQVDHHVAVAEGGGESGIENLRTLCTPCHAKETALLRTRLKHKEAAQVMLLSILPPLPLHMHTHSTLTITATHAGLWIHHVLLRSHDRFTDITSTATTTSNLIATPWAIASFGCRHTTATVTATSTAIICIEKEAQWRSELGTYVEPAI